MTISRSRNAAVRAPRQPRQPRAHRKVARLVQAARVCFDRDGFAKTTMARIAREARVSVGTAYAYFRDKEDVLATVLEAHVQELLAPAETIVRTRAPRASLRATLTTLLEHGMRAHEEYPGLHRVFYERIIQDPRLHAIAGRFRARGRAVVQALITQYSRRPVRDLDATTEVILGLLEYCTNIGTLYVSSVSRAQACTVAIDMIGAHLRHAVH